MQSPDLAAPCCVFLFHARGFAFQSILDWTKLFCIFEISARIRVAPHTHHSRRCAPGASVSCRARRAGFAVSRAKSRRGSRLLWGIGCCVRSCIDPRLVQREQQPNRGGAAQIRAQKRACGTHSAHPILNTKPSKPHTALAVPPPGFPSTNSRFCQPISIRHLISRRRLSSVDSTLDVSGGDPDRDGCSP